jgi:spore germination protein YaaH
VPSTTSTRRRAALALLPVLALAATLLPASPAAAKKDDLRPIVSGWLPYWSTSESVRAMTENKDLLAEVSPFWYTVRWSSGSGSSIGTSVSSANKATTKSAAAAAGIKLWPSFTDSMPARRLAKVMSESGTRTKLVKQMVRLAVDEGYAGLDLDFEKFAFSDGSSTWSSTQRAWVKFVRDLGNALHAKGKELAATTPPMCNVAGVCGTKGGYWVYDWAGIAPYIDRLRIMAYDYSWTVPGPIGPYPWAEKIVQFAITQVPAGKVQLGVPTYGRDWVRRTSSGALKIKGSCPVNNRPDLDRHTFDSVSAPTILANRGLTKADVRWSDQYKESWYRWKKTYSGKNSKGKKTTCKVYREGWYGDSRAVAARAGLVGMYQIAGIAAWTIGREDPAQWGLLREVARGLAPVKPVVKVAAPSTVDYGASARVSVTASAQGVPVAGTSVKLQWRGRDDSSWRAVATGKTDADGYATWQSTIRGAGTFRVVVPKSYAREQATGSAAVRVRPTLVPADRRPVVPRGTKVRLKAKLTPDTGQRVVLQRRAHGTFERVAVATVGRAGNAHLKLRMTRDHGAYRFKAKSSAVAAKSYSAIIKVRTT